MIAAARIVDPAPAPAPAPARVQRWGFAWHPLNGATAGPLPPVPADVAAPTHHDAVALVFDRVHPEPRGWTLIARPVGGWWWFRVDDGGAGSTSGLTWTDAAARARDHRAAGRTVAIGRCFPYGWRRPDGTVIRFRDDESIDRGERAGGSP